MRMPKNLGRRAILAGVGMALAGSVVAGTADADASTLKPAAQPNAAATKVADWNVSVTTYRHHISARAALKDTTSGNDYVAIQLFVQRYVNRHWVTVVTASRKAANNYVVSTISSRPCTAGATYRAYVNLDWNHRRPQPAGYPTRAIRCLAGRSGSKVTGHLEIV